ncbi:MAG: Rqc2 family fibronectin-binding protein [Oscillospiraceae bacterium]
MALDAMYLKILTDDLKKKLLGARVDKIHQISKEEILITLRSLGKSYKLIFSCRANGARVNITEKEYSTPKTPPMFCMLLRKHLLNGKLEDIKQPNNERILFFCFNSTNEIGDVVQITIAIEIMGRHSNIIIVKDNIILDAIKRVNFEMSKVRQILPNMPYEMPPQLDKKDILKDDYNDIIKNIENGDYKLSKGLINNIGGMSPILAREVSYLLSQDVDCDVSYIYNKKDILKDIFKKIRDSINNLDINPCMVKDKEGNFIDFSFIDIKQYQDFCDIIYFDDLNKLLDNFFDEKDKVERIKQKSGNLTKHIMNLISKLEKKVQLQLEELLQCDKREEIKLKGDLVNANLYNIKKGDKFLKTQNFYSENLEIVDIRLEPNLTPVQNLQKYYNTYKKTYNAEKNLKEQIKSAKDDILYLDSVFDNLLRSISDNDVEDIKFELSSVGYLKTSRLKDKKQKRTKPLQYISSDGFTIYAGKNNIQNDLLTLKQGKKYDVWFHTQKSPGSHVIVVTNKKDLPDKTYTEAAMIAAYNSKSRQGSQVPVDYTNIKNIKKPPNAKLGMVTYDSYYTAYVTPDEEYISKLIVK